MKIVKSMFKTVSMITLFAVITRFLGFIFRVYLSRKLGAIGLGVYQIATSVVGVFMTLVASGLPLTTAKMVARYDSQKLYNKKHIVTSTSLIIALIISVISMILLFAGQNVLNLVIKNDLVIDLIILMCPALLFSSVYAVFRGTLWGQNAFFWVSFTELLEQIVRMLLAFIVLGRITSLVPCTKALAFTFTLTCVISSIIVIFVYFCKGGKLHFAKNEYKNILKSSSPITAVRLASSFVQPLTAILIPFLLIKIGFSSNNAIGTYGVIMGMTFPLLLAPLSIVGSLSMVLIPKISVLYANKEYDSISHNIISSINFSMFLSALLVPLYLSCGNLIGLVLYNNLSSGIYLQLSAVCIFSFVLNNITNSVLNALNLEVKSFVNYIIGIVVMFVGLCTLTFVLKENAIIVALFLSTTTTAFLNLRMINKELPTLKSNIAGLLLKYALIILPSSIIGHLISNTLFRILPAIIAGFIGGGVSILFTYLLVSAFGIYKFSFKKKLRH